VGTHTGVPLHTPHNDFAITEIYSPSLNFNEVRVSFTTYFTGGNMGWITTIDRAEGVMGSLNTVSYNLEQEIPY